MNVILFGPPGCGKGTVAGRVKDRYNLAHLSTGDMLREEIKKETELGKLAKDYIAKGQLVPDDVIIGMVENRLKSSNNGILFDGFPRTLEQAQALSKVAKIDGVVKFICSEDEIVSRVCQRRVCKACGAVFNLEFLKGDVCEVCGGPLYIRDDDNEQTVRERCRVYQDETQPLTEYYDKQGLLYQVDSNINRETTERQLVEILNRLKEQVK